MRLQDEGTVIMHCSLAIIALFWYFCTQIMGEWYEFIKFLSVCAEIQFSHLQYMYKMYSIMVSCHCQMVPLRPFETVVFAILQSKPNLMAYIMNSSRQFPGSGPC